jgi:hypothetical protein
MGSGAKRGGPGEMEGRLGEDGGERGSWLWIVQHTVQQNLQYRECLVASC